MSLTEIAASFLGVGNIMLIIRRSAWNYPFALAMVTLYFFIFRDAKLYSDAGLQVFFFAVNVYGWRAWVRHRAAQGDIKVDRLDNWQRYTWIAVSLIATLCWGAFMQRTTDASMPYWDASVAMLSIGAQMLMIQRKIDNWHWWIVVNLVSIPLYVTKELYLTAALYGLFLLLAIWGLVEWRRAEDQQA